MFGLPKHIDAMEKAKPWSEDNPHKLSQRQVRVKNCFNQRSAEKFLLLFVFKTSNAKRREQPKVGEVLGRATYRHP